MKFFGVIKSVKVLRDRIAISVVEGPGFQAELPRHTYPRAGDYVYLEGMRAGWCPRVGGPSRPLQVITTKAPVESKPEPVEEPMGDGKPHLQLRTVAEGKGTVLEQYVAEDRVRLALRTDATPNVMLLVVDKTPTTCSIGPKDMLTWDKSGLNWVPLDKFGRRLCDPQPIKGRSIEDADKAFFVSIL